MSRTFYSEYVNHCLRFYARHTNPNYRSEADKKNWQTCDEILKGFGEKEREMLIAIYGDPSGVAQMVEVSSEKYGIKKDTVWKYMNELERKVAKKRGLI